MCPSSNPADRACVTTSEQSICLEPRRAPEPLYNSAAPFDLIDDRQFKSQRVVSLTKPFSRFHYVLLKIDRKV